MPCYHFIFHGYGTWMPDEDDGYVRRHEDRLPQDTTLAAEYRGRMTAEETLFHESQQQVLIDETHVAAQYQDFRVHYRGNGADARSHARELEGRSAFRKAALGNLAIAVASLGTGICTARIAQRRRE